MPSVLPNEITNLLNNIQHPNDREWNIVLTQLWTKLEQIAEFILRKEYQEVDLNAQELITEAWLKVNHGNPFHWNDRIHFYNTMSQLMRQVLVDYAKKRKAQKRIPQHLHLNLEHEAEPSQDLAIEEMIYLNELLIQFKKVDERACEIFTHRYFLNLKIKELSALYDVTERTILRELEYAKTWFKQAMAQH